MKLKQAPTEFTVFHLLVGHADAHTPAVEEWLRTKAFGRIVPDGPEAEELLARHPISSRVIGFAGATVSMREDAMVFDCLTASIGPEPRVITTAAQALHNYSGKLLTYSGNLRGLRMLARRALLRGMPEKFVLASTIERASDLADLLMADGVEVVPPVEVVAEALKLGPARRLMPVAEISSALRSRDHTKVLGDVVWALEIIASMYAATYYGDRLPVRWRVHPSSNDAGECDECPDAPGAL